MRTFIQRHPFLWACVSFFVVGLPQWIASVWSLFSSEPLGPVLSKKFREVGVPSFSPYLITVPIGLSMFAIIWFEVRRGRSKSLGFAAKAQTSVKIIYDGSDPICNQSDGNVYMRIVGEGDVHHKETLYRIRVDGTSKQLRSCRIVLEGVEPQPHIPGMQRIGLPMRPQIPQFPGSEEFLVNPSAPAYVDILQEVVRADNPMHEWSRIRLIYANENRGRANWFDNGDYVLTFRLEGPCISEPMRIKVAVEFDGRRQYRRWRVKQIGCET